MTRLVASMPTHNEIGRYLPEVVEALLTFVDEIRVLDDGSDDGTYEWLRERDGVVVIRNTGPKWREHEAQFRRTLQAHTLTAKATHVLAIDADELIADGSTIRATIEEHPRTIAFGLRMVEIWNRTPPTVRHDGGWRPREVGILYRLPGRTTNQWEIYGPALACPRVPRIVASQRRRAVSTGVDILHLGWADPAERKARHARYAELDGGKFHARSHLDSILWPDERCDLRPYDH